MAHYKGKDAAALLMSGPLVPEFEIECLQLAIEILERRQQGLKSSFADDALQLAEAKAGKKWRWMECLYYRMGQKKLLEFHIAAYRLLILILQNIVTSGLKFKDAYLKPCPPFESSSTEVPPNRMIFREYLRQLALSRKAFLNEQFD